MPAPVDREGVDAEVPTDSPRTARAAVGVDGEDFASTEVLEVAFDEEFGPETFVFVPPPGEELPRCVAAAWQLRVHYMPAQERPRTAAAHPFFTTAMIPLTSSISPRPPWANEIHGRG